MSGQLAAAENGFLKDVEACQLTSRQVLRQAKEPDAARSIALLQSLLAAEIVCVLRYSLLAISEEGLRNDRLATEFQAQADDERRHLGLLANRIAALGGVPDFNPAGLHSQIEWLGSSNGRFAVQLQQNLAAEQCVVAQYRELATVFDRHDPETALILRDILQDEEDHTSDMQDLLVSEAAR
jgi:bacterioferritin